MIVAVPAWGKHYVNLFLGPVLRSHRAAIERLRREFQNTVQVRYVVQTDAPVAIAKALGDLELTLVPAPPSEKKRNPMRAMATAHAHAINGAAEYERVILLNADILVSVEAFAAAERQFRQGKKTIVCSGTRTIKPWLSSFKPMKARELHRWSMNYAHPITKSCFWGEGMCHLPWGLYFRQGDSTVLRAFHLHPFAVVKDRPLNFSGTIDMDLVDNFSHSDIHIVTDADEMAIAEISPPQKVLGDNPWPIDVGQIVAWALRGARPMHWWNFRHRIIIEGDGAEVTEDEAVAEQVMRLCPYEAAFAPL